MDALGSTSQGGFVGATSVDWCYSAELIVPLPGSRSELIRLDTEIALDISCAATKSVTFVIYEADHGTLTIVNVDSSKAPPEKQAAQGVLVVKAGESN